ncbi:MAG: glycosyltransferase family 9 protein [Bryobacteraceae bacterium]
MASIWDEPASRALFRDVIEPLADRFEPALCDEYVRLFAPVVESVYPDLPAAELVARYERVRRARPVVQQPQRVYVLSRVTLGADVAVTSIVLDAAKKRWPDAGIVFAGPAKNYELYAADPRIRHLPVAYPRAGTLRERLAVRDALNLAQPDAIVIDPDSRLTQLGLLPVCPEDRYYFFESRAYGGDSADSLVALTKRWVSEVLGIADARAFVAVPPAPRQPDVTVSFGVGENPAKRVPGPFEAELLRLLLSRYGHVVVDSGGGGKEAERVRAAVSASGDRAEVFTGSFAEFAALIARSRLYVGYDSAGGHVAASCGTPLVSIFAGFVSERMLQRWRPDGPGPVCVIRADDDTPGNVLARVERELVRRSAPAAGPAG